MPGNGSHRTMWVTHQPLPMSCFCGTQVFLGQPETQKHPCPGVSAPGLASGSGPRSCSSPPSPACCPKEAGASAAAPGLNLSPRNSSPGQRPPSPAPGNPPIVSRGALPAANLRVTPAQQPGRAPLCGETQASVMSNRPLWSRQVVFCHTPVPLQAHYLSPECPSDALRLPGKPRLTLSDPDSPSPPPPLQTSM